jgi:cell division initiation protein
MALTPEAIQGKRFHDAFRGYNHEEVDVFLDEVAAAVEALLKDLQAGRARVEEVEALLDDAKGTEGILKRTLIAAQRAADEAVAEAKAEAAELVSIAEDQAAAAVAAARQQAEDIIAAANARQSQIEEADSRLQALYAEHRATLRAHLEDQLRALDGLPNPPAPEPDPGAEPVLAPDSVPDSVAADPSETPPEPPAPPVSSFNPRPSRGPLRAEGSAGGAEENRDPTVRELFWRKD